MSTLSIRVRTPDNKVLQYKDLTDSMQIYELLLKIEGESGIPFEKQQLLLGFPPKPLQVDSAQQTLAELKVKNGEQFILKEAGTGGIIKGKLEGKYVAPTEKRGYFVRRTVPGDNSCLFHSLAYVLKNRSRLEGPQLRATCAQIVLENPKKYNTAYLGMPTEQYYAWISSPDSWGGGIELRIMSDFFQTEIVSFDTCTAREDVFGEDQGYTTRVMVIYTGNHYDALALAPHFGAPESQDQTVFSTSDKNVLTKAREYVKEEQQKYLKSQAGKK